MTGSKEGGGPTQPRVTPHTPLQRGRLEVGATPFLREPHEGVSASHSRARVPAKPGLGVHRPMGPCPWEAVESSAPAPTGRWCGGCSGLAAGQEAEGCHVEPGVHVTCPPATFTFAQAIRAAKGLPRWPQQGPGDMRPQATQPGSCCSDWGSQDLGPREPGRWGTSLHEPSAWPAAPPRTPGPPAKVAAPTSTQGC